MAHENKNQTSFLRGTLLLKKESSRTLCLWRHFHRHQSWESCWATKLHGIAQRVQSKLFFKKSSCRKPFDLCMHVVIKHQMQLERAEFLLRNHHWNKNDVGRQNLHWCYWSTAIVLNRVFSLLSVSMKLLKDLLYMN